MKYDPDHHFAMRDYLEAVANCLSDAAVAESNRKEISQNIVAQFEEMLQQNPDLDETAYVAALDDPDSFALFSSEDSKKTLQHSPSPSKSRPKLGVIVAVALLIVSITLVIGIGTYMIHLRNEIVSSRTGIKASRAQIETTLQRRYDLIPNLVETVKGYTTHEQELFIEVARLRSQWAAAESAEARQAIQPQVEKSMIKLVALAEQYPALAASEQFIALQFQLEGTENRIAIARNRFNDVLRQYNELTQRFPANLFGYEQNEDYFEAAPEAKVAPKVQF